MERFSDSEDNIPTLLKHSEKNSKEFDSSYKAKTHELFNIFCLYFSKQDLIKFPIRYIFYLIEFFQLLSFAFDPQVYFFLNLSHFLKKDAILLE